MKKPTKKEVANFLDEKGFYIVSCIFYAAILIFT